MERNPQISICDAFSPSLGNQHSSVVPSLNQADMNHPLLEKACLMCNPAWTSQIPAIYYNCVWRFRMWKPVLLINEGLLWTLNSTQFIWTLCFAVCNAFFGRWKRSLFLLNEYCFSLLKKKDSYCISPLIIQMDVSYFSGVRCAFAGVLLESSIRIRRLHTFIFRRNNRMMLLCWFQAFRTILKPEFTGHGYDTVCGSDVSPLRKNMQVSLLRLSHCKVHVWLIFKLLLTL